MNSAPLASIDPRRHDFDALRAFAMLLGIALHASISFFPVTWPIQDRNQNDLFGVLFLIIHGFRMPLFFVLSGFFTAMLWRRRGLTALLKHRFQRIVIPLVLSMVTIVPLTSWSITWAVARSASLTRVYSNETAHSASLWELARDQQASIIASREWSLTDLNTIHSRLGSTPLSIATIKGHREIVEMLLDMGADANARNKDGGTALQYACQLGRSEIAKVLLDHGADSGLVSALGESPVTAVSTDFAAANFIAGLYQVALDEAEFLSGKEELGALFQAELPNSHGHVREQSRSWSEWINAMQERPFFAHLWFLWFLCWLVVGFAIYAKFANRIGWRGWKRAGLVSPVRYLWLLPLTMIPQWWMSRKIPLFGPDTSTGLIPVPHVLAYYAVFFVFGAIYFEAQDETGRLGNRWYFTLPVALLLCFPVGAMCVFGSAELAAFIDPLWIRLLGDLCQVSFAWLMTFGLMGLSRRFLNAESQVVRYVSDSAYWLYLAHMPLIFWMQAFIQDWKVPAVVKFLTICLSVTGVLLFSYAKCVRYTWLGTLLNGQRTRPVRKPLSSSTRRLDIEPA